MTDIVLEVIDTLDLGVPRLVVNVEVSKQADTAVGLHQTTTRVRLESLSNNAVLNCHVGSVSADRKGLVAPP